MIKAIPFHRMGVLVHSTDLIKCVSINFSVNIIRKLPGNLLSSKVVLDFKGFLTPMKPISTKGVLYMKAHICRVHVLYSLLVMGEAINYLMEPYLILNR